jgi:NADP-dependent 3-hydroxy acid dehydrogenase YdfG
MSDVEGKVVAITGASSGIGEATALLLAERGAAVLLGARRTARLDTIVDGIRDRGGRAASLSTDVTRREDLDRLVGRARAIAFAIDQPRDVEIGDITIRPTPQG